MNSHRLIAVVGAAALAACLTACSAGTNTDASGSSSAAAGAEANTDTASTPGAPTAPATANYTAPEGNQVAPLLTVTHVPAGHPLVDNGKNDRLVFSTAGSADDIDQSDTFSAYMIRPAEEGTTVDTVIQDSAGSLGIDASGYTPTGEVSVDGETAQTYQGGGADPNGGGYVAERGAVVTHNGKTFVIRAMAADKNTQPTVSEEEFNAFLKGIVWTD